MKKRAGAKRASYVERKLAHGGKIRIPYKIKKATAGKAAKFEVSGDIKLSDVELRSTELKSSVQTKADNGTVWLLMGPLWLRANQFGTNVVDPIQRDVKKVLAALKQQVAAGETLD